ncbi:GNAT family N-acetyltransferase [Lysinibacillus sp. B2A1]|nr:GNAT family N-acetyltransferase [Lysinibacillus sp. B2A1]
MSIQLKQCILEDLDDLQKISKYTYMDTYYDKQFRHMISLDTINTNLERAFNKNQLKRELSNVSTSFYFIYFNDELAGYIKINVDDAQSDSLGDQALEIERIYVGQSFQGYGLGKALINKALEMAQQLNKKVVWLGVWEKNLSAIQFYENTGFSRFSTHDFQFGNDVHTDFIMRKLMD